MQHTKCEHKWCIDIDIEDRSFCHECEYNYYMAWNNTKCWHECPLEEYVQFSDEEDEHDHRMCAPI